MNAARTPGRHFKVTLCALGMTGLAALMLLWWGLTLLTAVIIAIVVSCPLAALYAWWLSRRALRPLERVGAPHTENQTNHSTIGESR